MSMSHIHKKTHYINSRLELSVFFFKLGFIDPEKRLLLYPSSPADVFIVVNILQ